MRPLAFSLIYCLLTINSLAQAPRLLTGILTAPDGSGLPYATAGVMNQAIGTVADATGHFRLALPATVSSSDTIRFALLGYQPLKKSVADLTQTSAPLMIRLKEAALTLPEAAVKGQQLKRRRIGNHNWNANMQTNFAIGDQPGQNVGSEIGRIFQLPRGGVWLDTLRFAIGCTFDSVRLRINLYTLGPDGQPDQPLLTRPIYLRRQRGQRGWAIADLRAENLFITHQAIVAAVEWVSHSAGPANGRLALPITLPAFGTHLYRYGAANRWKRFPGMSACLELFVSQPRRD